MTDRDKAILLDLHRYGLHTTASLASRHFPGVATTTVLRRLRILEARDLIQRIPGLECGGLAWALTKQGAEAYQPDASKVHFAQFALDHDLKLRDLRLRMEGVGIARSWRPEHDLRARIARKYGLAGVKERVVPDGLMGVAVGDAMETVAVELELSIKNQSRYRRVFRDYATKKNTWAVWYVVQNPGIGRQLMKAAKDVCFPNERPYVLWSVLDGVLRDPLGSTVEGMGRRFRLGDLWTPGPAHPPAQGVSTPEGKNAARTSNPSPEENKENFVPT